MSRTLVIPDIHNRSVQAQILIDKVPCDRIVLLGDYFDSFGDNSENARNTAIWLKELVLTNPKITALMGNHDQSYRWSFNPHARCSGYTEAKKLAIYSVLNSDDFNKLKIFTVDQGYVLSHAGLTNAIWKQIEDSQGPTTLEAFIEILQGVTDRNIHCLNVFQHAPLFAPGWTRGGQSPHGGITWGDWSDFAPINGINQIVGHSIQQSPDILVQKAGGTIKTYSAESILREKNNPFEGALSVNYCLDTNSEHYAIIEDGRVDIYDTQTRRLVSELVEEKRAIELEKIEALKREAERDPLMARIKALRHD